MVQQGQATPVHILFKLKTKLLAFIVEAKVFQVDVTESTVIEILRLCPRH